MINIKTLIPGKPTHPGQILLDELNARKMTQMDLSIRTGIKRSQLNEIIKGKRRISAGIAVLLEKPLGIDARYWLDAQIQYDLDYARKKLTAPNPLTP